MNNRFADCQTIEDAKTIFRAAAHSAHPDHGGSDEAFKILMSEYESFLNDFIADRFEAAGDRTGNADFHIFQEILNEIIHFNMDIEIIGFWIYARSSYDYKDQLKDLGFWFSGKHKAWVYNGDVKRKVFRNRMTLDDIRRAYGSDHVQNEKEREAIV